MVVKTQSQPSPRTSNVKRQPKVCGWNFSSEPKVRITIIFWVSCLLPCKLFPSLVALDRRWTNQCPLVNHRTGGNLYTLSIQCIHKGSYTPTYSGVHLLYRNPPCVGVNFLCLSVSSVRYHRPVLNYYTKRNTSSTNKYIHCAPRGKYIRYFKGNLIELM